jgi:hypothetical protein
MQGSSMLTVKQVATALGIDERSVRDKLTLGTLKGTKKTVGQRDQWFVHQRDLDAELARRGQSPINQPQVAEQSLYASGGNDPSGYANLLLSAGASALTGLFRASAATCNGPPVFIFATSAASGGSTSGNELLPSNRSGAGPNSLRTGHATKHRSNHLRQLRPWSRRPMRT